MLRKIIRAIFGRAPGDERRHREKVQMYEDSAKVISKKDRALTDESSSVHFQARKAIKQAHLDDRMVV